MPRLLRTVYNLGEEKEAVDPFHMTLSVGRVGKVYEWLGLTVGVVVSSTEHDARRPAFEADVTFITAQELCFTFLRDQTVDDEQRIVRIYLSCDCPCVLAGDTASKAQLSHVLLRVSTCSITAFSSV